MNTPKNANAVLQQTDSFDADPPDAGQLDAELIVEQILADPELLQQITRTQNDECETVVAYFRCQFAPNQQRAVVHLPLVPPFAQIPEVQTMAVDHDSATVRVTDRHKFGIRAEVVLPRETKTQINILIEIIASSSSLRSTHRD